MKLNYLAFYIACSKAGLKVTDAVKRAGCNIAVLSSIKHGKNVNAATAGKLAAALGVPVEDLLDLER